MSPLLFAALGAGAHVCQILLLRELFALCLGTETAVALLLGVWLAGAVAGNGAGAWLTAGRREPNRCAELARAVAVALALLVPLALLACREGRWLLGAPAGGLLPVRTALLVAVVTAGGVAFGVGLLFPLTLATLRAPATGGAASAYGWDAFGAAVASALLSLWLLTVSNPLTLAALAVGAILFAQAWMQPQARDGGGPGPRRLWLPAAVTVVGLLAGNPLDQAAHRLFWRRFAEAPFALLETRQTPYGLLSVVRYQDQVCLYQAGRLQLTLPPPEETAPWVHLALLQHSQPRRVLLIGGTYQGLPRQILGHPVEALTCVQAPPAVADLVEAHLPPLDRAALQDRRTHVLVAEPRRALRTSPGRYEVILVCPPEPNSLAGNRFYTQEFFLRIRDALVAGGLMAFGPITGQGIYAEGWLLARNRVLLDTVRTVFPRAAVSGGSGPVILARRDGSAPEFDLAALEAGRKERELPALDFLPLVAPRALARSRHEFGTGQPYNPLVLAPASHQPSGVAPGVAPVNSDERPRVYLLSTLAWTERSGERWASWLGRAARLSAFVWVLPFAALLVATVACRGRARRRLALGHVTLGVGFLGAVSQWIILASFQATLGSLYQWAAAILGALMLGMALGTVWGNRRPVPLTRLPWRVLAAAAVPLLLAGWLALGRHAAEGLPGAGATGVLVLDHTAAALVVGLLVGVLFAWVTWSAAAPADSAAAGSVPAVGGWFHGLDLLGGLTGYALAACLLVPAYGAQTAARLSAAVVATTAVGLWWASKPERRCGGD